MQQNAALNRRTELRSAAKDRASGVGGARRSAAPSPDAAADQRLLGFLAKMDLLDPSAVEAAKAACRATNRSALEILHEDGVLSDKDVAAAVARGLGLPLFDLSSRRIDEWIADLVEEPLATRSALLAVAADDLTLTLAMANPFDQEAIRSVEFTTGRRVIRAVAPRSEIVRAIAQAYGHAATLASVLANVPQSRSLELVGADTSSKEHGLDAAELAKEAGQAPIIKMVNLILADAIGARASDIHVEPGPNTVLVRYRIDGMLVDAHSLPKWVQNPLTARIKIMAKADITERRTPQDGSFTIRLAERRIDVRASVLPTTDGEKFVLRLLDPLAAPRRLGELGLAEQDLATIRGVLRKPEGMILVTGPTGSGKSSTLCAMIQEIYSPQRNIVTIENPVEIKLPGVSQVEINEKQGLTFATVLRSVLRQDPDVIMVGEIRDRETAEIAFRAAQTGHLVLSTLHTNDTASTITRLFDIGIEPYLISSSLIAVVAQRLVREICERCAEPAERLPIRERNLRRAQGCSSCHGTGFAGRTGCYEVFEVSPGIQRLIESRAAESQLRMLAEEQGMISLRSNALAKVEAGETTSDEATRVIQFDVRGPRCPQCLNSVEEHFMSCPYCRHSLRAACASCGKALKKRWTSCPYCSTATAAESVAAEAPAEVAAEGPDDREDRDDREQPSSPAQERPRVLIVDDYADVRMLVRVALQGSGQDMDISEAESGPEALELVETVRPHLVILDLMMPGMDGFEVCRALRANVKTAFIPILMLTALADTQSKSLGFLAGTDEYLVKPFENAELRSRVGWLLQRSYRLGGRGAATEAEKR